MAARPPGNLRSGLCERRNTGDLDSCGELDYAEAQDDYVALASEGKKHLKSRRLPASKRRSIRNSCADSPVVCGEPERVTRIEPYGKDSRVAILSNGAKLPVSRAGTLGCKHC